MNPQPLPGVLHIPCRKCGKPRHHFGVGWCWHCMTPAERLRFAHHKTPA